MIDQSVGKRLREGMRPARAAARGAVCAVLPDFAILLLRYMLYQRRLPNLAWPSSFSEKTLCKMMFDRNPLLPDIVDKLSVRDFVRERVGDGILNPIHAVYDRAEDIQLDALPDRFVLKASHGSNFNHFISNAAGKDLNVILPLARDWLASNYGDRMQEWVYKSIKPRLLAEAYLEPAGGELIDYKFFCFDGEPRFVKVLYDNTSVPKGRFLDLDWNVLPVMERQREGPPEPIHRPDCLAEMLDVCRRLSPGFDFIRVDLYDIGGRVVFSELTNYHNAARERFRPRAYDFTLGEYWNRGSMTYLPCR